MTATERQATEQRGIAAQDAVGLLGSSWGAYLSLLAAGRQLALWAAVMAVYPVADVIAAHDDTTPALHEVDFELFGKGVNGCQNVRTLRDGQGAGVGCSPSTTRAT